MISREEIERVIDDLKTKHNQTPTVDYWDEGYRAGLIYAYERLKELL